MNSDNDNINEIEKLLQALPPLQPSAALDARVRNVIASRTNWRWYASLAAGVMAAAAVVMIAFSPPTEAQRPAVTTAVHLPAVASTESDWSDEGIVGYSSEGPVRQYRMVEQYASVTGQRQTIEAVVEYVSEAY